MAKSASKKKSYHHGDLRRALIDAAVQLIEEGGPEMMTLRAAARKAKVSEAAPYRHFENKEALLAAVAHEGFIAFAARQRTALESADNPFERLRALGIAYVEYAYLHPSHFEVMFHFDFRDRERFPDLSKSAADGLAPLQQTVVEWLDSRGKPPDDARLVARAAWSLVHGLSILAKGNRFDGVGSREEVIELAHRVIDLTFLRLDSEG